VSLPPASLPFVKAASAKESEVHTTVRAPAHVAFRDDAVSRVGAPVEGRVVKLHVAVGDQVKAGAPLVTLHSPSAAAMHTALARAQVELKSARYEAMRQAQMLAKGVGVEAEKMAADSRVAQAEADLAGAGSAARLLGGGGGALVTLNSPIAGTVLSRNVTSGAAVQPGGDPLIEVGDPGAVWVIADVFDRDVSEVREGAAAEVTVASLARPLRGRVTKVGAALDSNLRRAPVYIELKEPTAGLRSGMYARADIETESRSAIPVPRSAVLIDEGDKFFVYVEQKPGTYHRRQVTLGQSSDDSVPVLSGLRSGDRVVVSGAILIDGAASRLL
jgi:cobalt-zinc-cadmium efflux system membrane fusion protein